MTRVSFCDCLANTGALAHVRGVRRRRRANLAKFCQLVQALDRQYRVQVLLSEVRVDVKVAHLNVAGPCRLRHHTIRRIGKPGITPLDFRVEGMVGFQGDSC